jgi:hypothetical protein
VATQDPPESGTPSGSDETWSTYSPPVSQPYPETPATPPVQESLPPTHVPYGGQSSYSGTYPPAPGTTGISISSDLVSTRAKGCGAGAAIIALVAVVPVIIAVILGVRAVSSGFDELDEGLSNPFESVEKPDLRTAAGFDQLVDALREENGSTTVFSAGIYKDYAVVYTPADKTSKRYYLQYFDGEVRQTSQGTTDDKRFDLSTIDATIVVKLLKKAETELVEDPTSVYVTIAAPQDYDNGAWFSVYASNDFMESGYFTADKTGKTVMEYLPE